VVMRSSAAVEPRASLRVAIPAFAFVLASACATGTSPVDGWMPPFDAFEAGDGVGEGEASDAGGDRDDDGAPGDDGTGPDGPCGICDDGIDCTVDTCDPALGTCLHDARSSLCDDGDPCTGAEACDVVLGCVPGTPVICDDGRECTADSCDPMTGTCDFVVTCVPPEVCDPDSGRCEDPRLCESDAECDDGNLCTGAERCLPDGSCTAGAPPSCDDGVDCTVDRCDPAAGGGAGACVSTAPDRDGDTYRDAACGGTDCDDGNASISPTAVEVCNAIDDDCDGATDEPAPCARGTTRPCTAPGGCTGVQTCLVDCTWSTCVVSGTEICNGGDDDCDGATDEGFACVRGSTTACVVPGGCAGTQTCQVDCTWGACAVTTAEMCNGGDDDCDGATDEGFACRLGTTTACNNACGAAGTQTCQPGTCTWGACCGPLEVCGNACDDDCDGSMNEGCSGGCTVVEGFESGVWPAPGWSGGSGTVTPAAAHDGSYGIWDPEWSYRTDVSVGSVGDRITVWVRPGGGRAYIGFAASSGGCKSFVAAPNTGDIRFQDNAGWGFIELSTSGQSFVSGRWYLMEIEFTSSSSVVGRLYDQSGTTLLNSVTQTYSTSLVGGLALRSFDGFSIDTISICRP